MSKENVIASTPRYTLPVRIKPEPNDNYALPLHPNNVHRPAQFVARPEPTEDQFPRLHAPYPPVNIFHQDLPPQTLAPPPAPLFKVYRSVDEVVYSPEEALKEGVGMVKAIKENIGKLELGSKMRKEVWLREVAGLESQGAPTTLIAVCGATGAGKSSLLNAILDDNIVPTSGMRACTAVVTEISYQDKPTIDADVSFLTEAEWRDELTVLLDDLVDEDGNVKRANDLRSEAGIAWHKVHAVYPSINQDRLARMDVDKIIEYDPLIRNFLGTTKHICAKDSKAFAAAIAKYIDSKDQKRDANGKKDKKKDKKDKKDKKSKKDEKTKGIDPSDGPALWPLIRQVQVKCKSATLSTGAILVDLPGVADANTARSNICKDYMKKCDCIWVLAPITRAVDDRTAKDLLGDAFKIQLRMDGNYDDTAITFIATKADDISCSEVISGLRLHDDEEIEEIEEKISEIKNEQKDAKKRHAAAIKAVKATEAELKEIRAIQVEQREHLEALKNDEPFQPKLTVKKGAPKIASKKKSPTLGKRKALGTGNKKSAKRQKSYGSDDDDDDDDGEDDEDNFIDDDEEEEEIESDSDRNSSSDSDSDDSNTDGSDSSDDSDSDSADGEMDVDEEITEASLEAKIEETVELIKTRRERLTQERQEKKKAHDDMINAKDRLARAQVEKNGICSLKRSEFSRDQLKQDFRIGLREIDEADAQERDPDNFDPTQQIRDYDSIDLPTFCASARDYIRITEQVKGDGNPACFTNVEDTGIPALQEWCRHLTVASRQRTARNFLSHLQSFVNSVRNYVEGITQIKEEDRKALREKWESPAESDSDSEGEETAYDPYSWLVREAWVELDDGSYSRKKTTAAKVDIMGVPIGISPRLSLSLEKVVDDAVDELKRGFEDGLNDKLQVGAATAAETALKTSDDFAEQQHWQTYRATLRRYGTFRRCLNTELINPLTKNIASSWARVFEADLFSGFETRALQITNELLRKVERSAAPGLTERAKSQGEIALEEVKVAMKSLVTVVREILNEQQKEISRCLIPHVQKQLRNGYAEAAEERGRGSVARQKGKFHEFIKRVRNEVFNGGADALLEKLDNAAESVGNALRTSLKDLSQKVEVSMSVLWESPRDDPHQIRARNEAVETLQAVDKQLGFWNQANKNFVQKQEA